MPLLIEKKLLQKSPLILKSSIVHWLFDTEYTRDFSRIPLSASEAIRFKHLQSLRRRFRKHLDHDTNEILSTVP